MTTYDRIILDIEGTTTSISFVYDVLFPFARTHVASFLEAHWSSPDVQSDVDELKSQCLRDQEAGLDPPMITDAKSAAANVLWQMDADRKTTGLKSLQGKIWKAGYEDGRLKGHVYADVPVALERWNARGCKVYIYSSGSIAAQKLIFGYSEAGDLRPLLSGYFDTTTGPKRELESYQKIHAQIGGENVLFATDVLAEAEAASKAGLDVVLMLRPQNPDQGHHSFASATDFSAIV
jgi:enolase-phosphatase E1